MMLIFPVKWITVSVQQGTYIQMYAGMQQDTTLGAACQWLPENSHHTRTCADTMQAPSQANCFTFLMRVISFAVGPL